MAPKLPSLDDPTTAAADEPVVPVLDKKKPAAVTGAAGRAPGKPAAPPPDDEDEDDLDELDLEDDEDDEELTVFTAKEAAGALATVYGFVRPFLKNYRNVLALVGLGVLVETLFNVIMPLSLKFLIDDALGEEDFEALVKILSVLAAAGIFTSIVAVWYERWDAKLAASLISDVRKNLFEHVQNLPSSYFARTKRGELQGNRLANPSSGARHERHTVLHKNSFPSLLVEFNRVGGAAVSLFSSISGPRPPPN